MLNKGNITVSWCNSCGRDTDHEVTSIEIISRKEFPEAGSASTMRSLVVRCGGCKEISIRNESWHYNLLASGGENDPVAELTEVTFSPPRLWRRLPDWLTKLERTEPDLYDLLQEIYLATHDGQVRLLASGVRTALDRVMVNIVGDVGDFPAKLNAMVAQGHLSSKQRDMLDTVIDAGSATAHRGFKPPRQLLAVR